MKREIKFRAWDGKKMSPSFSITSIKSDDKYAGVIEDWKNMIEQDYYYLDECEVMQFTGLKDKNGKDIYEGDILRMGSYIGEVKQLDGGMWYINHSDAILKYKYQIHCEVCETDKEAFFFDYLESWMIEVIGNIYKNPELL